MPRLLCLFASFLILSGPLMAQGAVEPPSPQSRITEAALGYFIDGDAERAVDLINEAMKEVPDYHAGYYKLAVLHVFNDEPKRARDLFEKYLEKDASSPRATLARLHLRRIELELKSLGTPESAREARVQKSLLLARGYLAHDMVAEAVDEAQSAVILAPKSYEPQLVLGLAKMADHEFVEALDSLGAALSLATPEDRTEVSDLLDHCVLERDYWQLIDRADRYLDPQFGEERPTDTLPGLAEDLAEMKDLVETLEREFPATELPKVPSAGTASPGIWEQLEYAVPRPQLYGSLLLVIAVLAGLWGRRGIRLWFASALVLLGTAALVYQATDDVRTQSDLWPVPASASYEERELAAARVLHAAWKMIPERGPTGLEAVRHYANAGHQAIAMALLGRIHDHPGAGVEVEARKLMKTTLDDYAMEGGYQPADYKLEEDSRWRYAQKQLERGIGPQAVPNLEQILEGPKLQRNDEAHVLWARGRARLLMGMFRDAEHDFTRSLLLGPEGAITRQLHEARGRARLAMGDHDGAVYDARRALRFSYSVAESSIGKKLLSQGLYAQATRLMMSDPIAALHHADEARRVTTDGATLLLWAQWMASTGKSASRQGSLDVFLALEAWLKKKGARAREDPRLLYYHARAGETAQRKHITFQSSKKLAGALTSPSGKVYQLFLDRKWSQYRQYAFRVMDKAPSKWVPYLQFWIILSILQETGDLPRAQQLARYCQKLWMTFLESRGDDLDAVLEVDPSDDVTEELVSIQFPPLTLGGLSELEDHGQARVA